MLLIAMLLLAGSFASAAVLTSLMRRVAPRVGLVDRPGGHKQHGRDVPLGGGVAILLTIALALLGSAFAVHALGRSGGGPQSQRIGIGDRGPAPGWVPAVVYENLPGLQQKIPQALVLLAGGAALFVLGLVDDYRPLGPAIKFIIELAVAAVVVAVLQVRAAVFLPSALSVAVTVLWIVAIINAVNFLDNMDGLCAGVVIVCGSIFTAAAAVNGQLFVPALLLVVIGAAAGFLLFNFPPARIFMGDSGSLVLGYFLGVLTVLTTYTKNFEQRPAAVLMPLIILAVPLYDAASVVVVRLAKRRHLIRSDRSHFSHRLLARGMTVRAALGTIYLATCATGLAAIFLMQLPMRLAWVVFVQTVCIVGIIALLELRWPKDRRP